MEHYLLKVQKCGRSHGIHGKTEDLEVHFWQKSSLPECTNPVSSELPISYYSISQDNILRRSEGGST